MGRGDKRSKRGKITIGSFGKKRPAKVVKAAPVAAATEQQVPAKKAAKTKKTEE